MAASTVAPREFADTKSRLDTRQQLSRAVSAVFVLDAVVIALSLVSAVGLKFGFSDWPPAGIQWLTGVPVVDFGWILPAWIASLSVHDVYSRRHFARGADEFKALLKGSLTAALVVSVLAYLVNYDMSRGFYLYAFMIGTTLLLLERYAVSRVVWRLRRADQLIHRVVAVGSPDEIRHLSHLLAKRQELGYQIVGVCLPQAADPPSLMGPTVGAVEDAVRSCMTVGADTLLVAGGSQIGSSELRSIGWDLENSDIDLIVVPSLLDVAGPRIHTRPVSGLPFMHIEPPHVARAMKWGKAVFDRSLSLALLIVLLPVFACIAIAVKVDSNGPVFFRHRRIGVGGTEFGVWKFRSMVPGAEARHDELVASGSGSVLLFKVQADPRVTRVGAFIRRYSLDELPQLVNVLAGDMSLVGPRPQVAAEVAAYGDSEHRRLLVRPGMTGLWQVSGRSSLSWEEAVRLDLYYVDNWSMTGDLVILFKTLRAVLRHDGAF